jgi:hypothetical protein
MDRERDEGQGAEQRARSRHAQRAHPGIDDDLDEQE